MKPKHPLFSFLLAAGSGLLLVSSANATQFWDGTGGDANWNTPENWGGDTLPLFTDGNTTATVTINFGGTNAGGTAAGNVVASQTAANNNLTAGSIVEAISFTNNGTAGRTQAFTLQGNSITLGNGRTNEGIQSTAWASGGPVENVISLDISLGTSGAAQNRLISANLNNNIRVDGAISGSSNFSLLQQGTGITRLTNANNSYLGYTNIANGGVLEVSTLADGGSNSSIGASSNAAGNLRFNQGFNSLAPTTLRYVGSANATTDRNFTIAGNSAASTTNSVIESSGAGTLSFTNNALIAFAGTNPNRHLILGGTNLGNNSFGLSLGNNGALASSFTKQGVGKWIITGTHTYTGATNVEEGTLLINGSTSTTSVVSVAANATLGGTGTIGGSVTVSANGILSPGASIESLAAASLSMASGSTFAYEVANNTSTGADLLAVDTTVSLTGVTLSLDAASLAALAGGVWNLNDKITLISYLGADITSGFTGYADDTSYFFGANEWFFDYNDTVAGGNYGTDAIAAGQDRFVTMTVIAIPEPRAALLGGLGLLALLRRRRA